VSVKVFVVTLSINSHIFFFRQLRTIQSEARYVEWFSLVTKLVRQTYELLRNFLVLSQRQVGALVHWTPCATKRRNPKSSQENLCSLCSNNFTA